MKTALANTEEFTEIILEYFISISERNIVRSSDLV
jgi:hypothetical protein